MLKNFIKDTLKKKFGIYIERRKKGIIYPVEASQEEKEIINIVKCFENPKERLSMVPIERLWAVIQATKYIVKNNIDGDFVECGVWKGGCVLAMAMVLDSLNTDKKLYLFDTFEGMTKPEDIDVNDIGIKAWTWYEKLKKDDKSNWCYAPLDFVREVFEKYSLDKNLIFVKGDVSNTLQIKSNLPDKIALLRLDTDWYESTKIELEILYPLLEKKGVLLIDDYGYWKGSQKAVDEYLKNNDIVDRSILWRIDESGRALIKI